MSSELSTGAGRDAGGAGEPAAPRRLHPSSLLFRFLSHAKGLVVPVLVVLFLTPADRWELWLWVFVLPAMAFEAWAYLTFRYRLDPGELVVIRGVLFRSERRVPFARIQNVDSRQGFLQRLLGVAEARVETASGAEAEAELKVVTLETVEEIRRRIHAGRAQAPVDPRADAPDAEPAAAEPAPAGRVFEVSLRDLTLLGLDLGRGLALIAVGIGLAWELDLFERLALAERVRGTLERELAAGAFATLALAALAAIALVLLLSLLSTYARLYGFRLEPSPQGFRVRCGLFTRVATNVPRRRIQLLSIQEPPLLRWLGRAAVKVETAGAGPQDGEQAATRQWLLPVVARARLPELLREIEPRLDLDGAAWRPLAPGARRRMRNRALLASLLVSALALAVVRPWGALVLPVVLPFAVWIAHREAAYAAWCRTDYGVLHRSGALYRKVAVVFFGRIQVVASDQTPFDRRHRHASLRVDTAGGGKVGHGVRVRFLERDVAQSLHADLVERAERTPLVLG